MRVSKISAATSLVVANMLAQSVMAASQTWSASPTDANWTTAANWAGAGVPGINPTANAHNTTDIATFNSAIFGTIGDVSNPIIVDGAAGNISTNRMIGQIIFDTANVGSYYIGATGTTAVMQFRNNTNGTSGIIDIMVNAAVTNAQTINSPIALHLPSSTNGFGGVSNDSTTTSATLTLAGGINNSPNSTRGSVWTLTGSNTGLNTVSGVINLTNSGGQTSRIIKNGTGTWRLTAANTIGGGTTIDAGTLIAGNIQALGVAANAVTVNAGTLQLDGIALGNNSVTLNGTGGIRANGSSSVNAIAVGGAATDVSLGTTNASDVFTAPLIGVISGGSASTVIHATGPGTLALNTINTYTGNWSFDGGITNMAAGISNTLGSNPGANFGGGTLILNDNVTSLKYLSGTAGTLTNNGTTANTVTVNQATDTTFAGSITDGSGVGSIALTKTGAGAVNLSGSNSYTGATTINAGTVRVNGSLTNSAVTVNNTGTLGGNGTVSGTVTVNSGGKFTPGSAASNIGTLNVGSLNLNSGSLGEYEFGTGNDIVNVTTAGGLTLGGTALSLFIDGTNTAFATVGSYTLFDYNTSFSGSLANLSIANPQAGFNYAFSNDLTNTLIKLDITAAGVLAAWNVDADGSWSTGGNWNPAVPTAAGDSATFGGAITSNHTVSLDGNKSVGAIVFNNSAASYLIDQGSGGTLSLNSGTGGGAGITVQAGSHSISAPVALADTGNHTMNTFAGTSLTISGAVSGGNLVKSGTGTLFLTNAANTFGNTSINGGTVEFVSGALNGASSALTLNGGTLRYATGNTQDVSVKTVTLSGTGGSIDTNGNNVTFANSIGNGGGGGLTKSGAGTLTVAASNNYSGATSINGGTLSISSNASLGVPSAGAGVSINGGTLLGTATMTLDNAGSNQRAITVGASGATISSAASTIMTITGGVSGSGALTKSGAGDVEISSDNSATFTGPVTVNGGILRLNNGNAIAGSVLNYNNAGGSIAFGPTVTAASVKSIVGDQNIVLTNDAATGVALSFGSDNTAWTYNGSFSGLGSIIKQGSGLLTLTGTSVITGSVTLQNVGSALTIPTGGSLTASSYNATGIAGGLLTISGGTLVANTATSNILNGGGGGPGNTGFLMSSGSATFADVNLATDNNNANIPFVVNGGTLTLANFVSGRSGTSVTVEPVAGATNYGMYVNGGTVSVTGTLGVGQSVNANSNSSWRMDAGSTTVAGVITIGHNNAGRWTALDVNGGTFTSSEATTGVTFGHGSGAGNGTFIVRGTGVANVEKFTLGNLATTSFGTIQVRAGGTLNLGSGGIVQNNLNNSAVLRLEQGLLTTAADFTPIIPINLAGAAGAQGTIQAADTSNVAKNVTVNVPMYGTGGFIKTGAGSMTVNGISSYTGPITNNAGTLTLNSPNKAAVNVTLTDTLSGLNLAIVNDTTNLVVGQRLVGTGTGFPEGSYITSIVDGTTVTMSNNATATITAGAVAVTADASSPVGMGTPIVTNNGTLNLPVSANIAKLAGTGTTNVTAAALNVAAGGSIIQNTLTTAAGTKVTIGTNGTAAGVSVINNLNLNATSKLDLQDNDLIVDYGANPTEYTNILNQVKAGLALLGGTDADFDGIGDAGIGSTAADLQTIAGTVLAVVDDGDPNIGGGITSLSGLTIPNPATSVLVKYTWFGDANLDGVVDGSDYALTDTGFTSGGSLTGWVFGDMNFDGLVTGEDYALVDTGFIAQTGALPEPTTLGLLGLGAMGMLRRRRKA